MNNAELSIDTLLQETLAMTEFLRVNNTSMVSKPGLYESLDARYDINLDTALDDLADNIISDRNDQQVILPLSSQLYPETPGVIYKIDNASSTFCVRGFSTANIRESFLELNDTQSAKRIILKLGALSSIEEISFFETKTYELAEAIREQIINRRFPHQEDALCNLSDPGFSWWMNADQDTSESKYQGRFEIFFRSHGINRAEKYIQLGPIGDGGIAALRMNQARSLLRSSFPISEFSCDDKSFTVASSKPEHLSFISFKNIFLEGVNHTELENFPDNSDGRTLFYYFHELAIVRKFWIEVKSKLG